MVQVVLLWAFGLNLVPGPLAPVSKPIQGDSVSQTSLSSLSCCATGPDWDEVESSGVSSPSGPSSQARQRGGQGPEVAPNPPLALASGGPFPSLSHRPTSLPTHTCPVSTRQIAEWPHGTSASAQGAPASTLSPTSQVWTRPHPPPRGVPPGAKSPLPDSPSPRCLSLASVHFSEANGSQFVCQALCRCRRYSVNKMDSGGISHGRPCRRAAAITVTQC